MVEKSTKKNLTMQGGIAENKKSGIGKKTLFKTSSFVDLSRS